MLADVRKSMLADVRKLILADVRKLMLANVSKLIIAEESANSLAGNVKSIMHYWQPTKSSKNGLAMLESV
jgi:hypothetical protein